MKNFTYLLLLLMSVLFTACTAEEMDLGDEALLNDDLYLDCCMDFGQMPAEPGEDWFDN